MSTYTIPDDPQCTVWGKDGQKFRYDHESGKYRAVGSPTDSFPLYWEELLVDYGPLTDIDPAPIRVGDVVLGPRHYRTLPHGAVFRQIGGVSDQSEEDLPDEMAPCIAVSKCFGDGSGGVDYSGAQGRYGSYELEEGPWERIY